jgi:hypothetical protein
MIGMSERSVEPSTGMEKRNLIYVHQILMIDSRDETCFQFQTDLLSARELEKSSPTLREQRPGTAKLFKNVMLA